MVVKTKEKKAPTKKGKLNKFTEEKNNQPPVEIEKAEIIGEEMELPDST